jgi:hypothetical protein
MTSKELRSAAAELNEVLDLEPRIDTKIKDDDVIKKFMQKAITMIDPDIDVITDSTQEVIDELLSSPAKKETKTPSAKAPAKSAKKAPVIDEDDEEDEDEDSPELPEEDEDDEEDEKPVKKSAKVPAKPTKKAPVVEEDEDAEEEDEKPAKKEPKGKPAKKGRKEYSNVRVTTFAEAMKESAKKPLTVDQIVDKVASKCVGSKNVSKFYVTSVLQYLTGLDLIEEKNGKISYKG